MILEKAPVYKINNNYLTMASRQPHSADHGIFTVVRTVAAGIFNPLLLE